MRRDVSWTLTKSWTIICGSRRDQKEGGRVGPSREPRRDQEEGGGAGPSREFRRDQEEGGAGPSREPRRDQEEGGGAGPSREFRRDQGEGGAGPSREPRRNQKEGGGAGPSRKPRRDQEQGGEARLGKLHNVMLQLFLNSCSTDILFVTLLRTAVEKQLAEHTSCFALAGSQIGSVSWTPGPPDHTRIGRINYL